MRSVDPNRLLVIRLSIALALEWTKLKTKHRPARELCTNTKHEHVMQALASRRLLQPTYRMPMHRRLVRLSRSTVPFRFGPTVYANPVPFSMRSASTSSGSSVEEKTHVFVIWAPDCTDKDALARRLAVRETHLHETKPGQESGYYCGPFLAISRPKLITRQCSAEPS